MQGSLKDPPILLRTSRWKWGLALFAFALLGGAEVAMGLDEGWTLKLAVVAIACGGVGLLCCFRLARPAWLELSPEKLVWFSGIKRCEFGWTEFARFEVCYLGRSREVAFTWSEQSCHRRAKSWLRTLRYSGYDGSFSGFWELPAEDVVSWLNRARRHWSAAAR